jgi:N6-L-threonylcarbamoyladenine synthase
MRILGIETSCDETAFGVVDDGRRLVASIVSSQVELHAEYGGVVPELASRKHVEAVIPVLDETLRQAGCELDGLDALAVTYGPGLAGALLVGVNFAKALAWSLGLPLVPVNHLEGHIYAAWLDNAEGPRFPSLVLIVSGGHSDIVLMEGHGRYQRLGQTVDDAAGEAFDKVARLLGLGFPGGPAVDRLASGHGRATSVKLPRARVDGEYDFSFSGLKSKVQRLVSGDEGQAPETAELAAAFQESVVDSLVTKALAAAAENGAREIILVGGVAANSALRTTLAEGSHVPVVVPPPAFCTDNGAMIAACAHYRFKAGNVAPLSLDVEPGLKIG